MGEYGFSGRKDSVYNSSDFSAALQRKKWNRSTRKPSPKSSGSADRKKPVEFDPKKAFQH